MTLFSDSNMNSCKDGNMNSHIERIDTDMTMHVYSYIRIYVWLSYYHV